MSARVADLKSTFALSFQVMECLAPTSFIYLYFFLRLDHVVLAGEQFSRPFHLLDLANAVSTVCSQHMQFYG